MDMIKERYKGDLRIRYNALEKNLGISGNTNKAIEMEIGARGLRSVMESIMTDIMYTVPSDDKVERVIITKECVKDGAQPIIIHKAKPQIDPDVAL